MNTFFDSNSKYLCTGCGACKHICPVNAIQMEEDEEGFAFPRINENLCIHCDLCKKTCPTNKESKTKSMDQFPKVYAVRNKNKEVLKFSSSGGVFPILADFVINNNGCVAGCIFDENLKPIHVIVNDMKYLKKFQGSKYVQSDMGEIFPQIKQILENDILLLFTGTPCQVAGLKAYLGKEYENLITADLVCHGVPSYWVFQKYLNFLKKTKRGEISTYRFRDKAKNGWGSDGSYYLIKENKIYKKELYPERDYYYYLFEVNNSILRESCYQCNYTSIKREGDFTMADFWRIQEFHPEFYSKEGVSMLMVNTEKAEKIFRMISSNMEYIPSTIENARNALSNLRKSSSRPSIRDTIYSDINVLGFEKAAKQYCKLQYIRPIFRRAIPYQTKQNLKQLFAKRSFKA